MKRYKIVAYVPDEHAEKVRDAMGAAGAGVIGNYTFCSFTLKGIGRFRPEAGAHPTIGEVGQMAEVHEDRIETVCTEEALPAVLEAIRRTHPYEEPGTDVYPLEVLE